MQFQFDEEVTEVARPAVQDRRTGNTIRVTEGQAHAVQALTFAERKATLAKRRLIY